MTENQSPFQSYPLLTEMRTAIEIDLRQTIESQFLDNYLPLKEMLKYHMGWSIDDSSGKRLRPLFVLLATHASGGDWHKALPAASAVELVHNFSLIHDDIQDKSKLRHNQPTLWAKVGIAQAINAGDAMLIIGTKKIWELGENYPPETILKCSLILQQSCLRLTQGQFLDIDFENRNQVNIQEYLEMISGKTTALITACTQIGAILGSADPQIELSFKHYGVNLGMAFQLVDDYLGIWGTEEITGKSSANDLLDRKKSFPIILGLTNTDEFYKHWENDPLADQDIPQLTSMLEQDGIRHLTLEKADEYTNQALSSLKSACKRPSAYPIMEHLTSWLLNRKV